MNKEEIVLVEKAIWKEFNAFEKIMDKPLLPKHFNEKKVLNIFIAIQNTGHTC